MNVNNYIFSVQAAASEVLHSNILMLHFSQSRRELSLKCSINTVEFTVALKPNQGTLRQRGVIVGGVLFSVPFFDKKKRNIYAVTNNNNVLSNEDLQCPPLSGNYNNIVTIAVKASAGIAITDNN